MAEHYGQKVWTKGTQYVKDDLVWYGVNIKLDKPGQYKYYKCLVDKSTTSSFVESEWTEVAPAIRRYMDVGPESTAVGYNACSPAQGAVAIGDASKAWKNGTVAIGVNSQADSDGSIAIGNGSSTTKEHGVAIGVNSGVNGMRGVAIGDGAKSNYGDSVAIGTNVSADVDKRVVIGNCDEIDKVYFGVRSLKDIVEDAASELIKTRLNTLPSNLGGTTIEDVVKALKGETNQ